MRSFTVCLFLVICLIAVISAAPQFGVRRLNRIQALANAAPVNSFRRNRLQNRANIIRNRLNIPVAAPPAAAPPAAAPPAAAPPAAAPPAAAPPAAAPPAAAPGGGK